MVRWIRTWHPPIHTRATLIDRLDYFSYWNRFYALDFIQTDSINLALVRSISWGHVDQRCDLRGLFLSRKSIHARRWLL